MSNAKKRDQVKAELYQAIAYFIQRQVLVSQAMRDLKLDLEAIGTYGALGWVSSISSALKDGKKPLDLFAQESPDQSRPELLKAMNYAEELKVPRKGFWKDHTGSEWEYQLHGAGCLLQNRQTSEPLDWDCPNPKAFDEFFFEQHLQWRLNSHESDAPLEHIREWVNEKGINSIQGLLEEMVRDGTLREIRMPLGPKYLLNESFQEQKAS